jgi:osmoprotectant transport system permease protein
VILPPTLVSDLGPPNPWFSWSWVTSNASELVTAIQEHIVITVTAVVLAVVISFPLALLARRYRRAQGTILAAMGVIYTIPALALIAALFPIFGFSNWTVIVPLTAYALVILVRNMIVGLDGVPADAVDAARGMGFSGTRLLWRVEVPLALPPILAGIRIATVSTIGLVTIGGYLGLGGLGQVISYEFTLPVGRAGVVTASLLCVLLALVADLLLLGVQRALTPWARRRVRADA